MGVNQQRIFARVQEIEQDAIFAIGQIGDERSTPPQFAALRSELHKCHFGSICCEESGAVRTGDPVRKVQYPDATKRTTQRLVSGDD